MNDANNTASDREQQRADSTPRSQRNFERILPDFDLTTVRCLVEMKLQDRVAKDEELMKRIRALSEDAGHSRVRTRLRLLTDGYRVDEAITPKLHRLGNLLKKILRLSRPLDMFVMPSDERNAFCLPSRKGNRLIMCLNAGLLEGMSRQELLFVMGHEVGHAILRHGDMPRIDFDNPDFSPLEVIQLRIGPSTGNLMRPIRFARLPGRPRCIDRVVQSCFGFERKVDLV